MQPDLDAVAEQFAGGTKLITVNAENEVDTVRSLGVKGTPTLIGYKDGDEVFRYTGRRSRSELEAMFSSLAIGQRPVGVGRQDLMLRVGTGLALLVAGLFTGPAWPLTAIGMLLVAAGFLPMWRRR
jgi:thioredoxin-like negative regulator of GroEL